MHPNKDFGSHDNSSSTSFTGLRTQDWKKPGATTITQRVLAGARPGAIILQHDIHGQTIDAMPAALDGLIAKGYHLVTVSQLIKMESPEASPTP
jgi:peptidoglycan-N-acetylglucosamine deacetylase